MQNIYVSRALDALRSERAEKIERGLQAIAVAGGGLAGGITLAYTGDPGQSTHAMFWPAVLFSGSEALRVGRDMALYGAGSIYQKLSRAACIAVPAVASWFLADTAYNPYVEIGSAPAWGVARGASHFADEHETRKIGYSLIKKSGRAGAIRMLADMSDERLALIIGKEARRKEVRR